MLLEDKNFKDGKMELDISLKDSFLSISYTKTNKLITALYMVTDIVDKAEPIRHKLRHLGAEIISDMHCVPSDACNKIGETVSFLNIASAMNLISEMNCTILKKEFLELNQCIKEYTEAKPTWLEEFLTVKEQSIGHKKLNGQQMQTRIGVQKGSTLMKALSDIKDIRKNNPAPYEAGGFRSGFDILKKERRFNIINIIKNNEGGVTIKDIKIKINSGVSGTQTSEKTVQRELMSMIKDGVLYKTGEKRWSRYFIKN